MTTQMIDLVTMIRSVQGAEEFLGENRNWEPVNETQRWFLDFCEEFGDDVAAMEDVKAKASRDISVLNAFLAENGFDISLEPIAHPEGFGVVAILDRLVRWLVTGREMEITIKDVRYPAFRLTGDQVMFFRREGDRTPIVAIDTQSGDMVYLAFADREAAGPDLVDKIMALEDSDLTRIDDYGGVVIPEVMFNLKPDIGFLKLMFTYDDEARRWFIEQALQQCKFAMNREGARIKSATAVGVTRSFSMAVDFKPDLVFDRPFFLWIEGREGSRLPVAMAYVDFDTWRKADLAAL